MTPIMTMSSWRPVRAPSARFDADVARRLAACAAQHAGDSPAAAAARFVDEGLRMAEHPGVVFRDGPTGRRAGLVAGPDVFEVIGNVRSARRAEPDLDESALMAMITENTGVTRRQLQTAVTYRSAFPDDIDSTLQHAAVVEAEGLLADERRRSLLRMA